MTYQLPLPVTSEIAKSNVLARARWNPNSIWEARIVALIASKIKRSDKDFFTYTIPVSELIVTPECNLDGRTYQEIKKALLNLLSMKIIIEEKEKEFMAYTFFSKCGYKKGNIIAGFHPDLKQHFLDLQGLFVKYHYLEYISLPSIYSQKLFEILKSWNNKPEIEISMYELHNMLSTPDSLKNDFAQFRRRVLEKAHKDHSKTSLQYEWTPIKQGRSVVSIRFVFGKKEVAKLQIEKEHKKRDAIVKAFNDGVSCAKSKNGICKIRDNKKSVCLACDEHKILEEFTKKVAKGLSAN